MVTRNAATRPRKRARTSVPATAARSVLARPSAAADAEVPSAKPKAVLVRDSFTMPQADFDLVASLKERALGFRRPAKKSELLRAGLRVLSGLDDQALRRELDALTPLKPGRPKKG